MHVSVSKLTWPIWKVQLRSSWANTQLFFFLIIALNFFVRSCFDAHSCLQYDALATYLFLLLLLMLVNRHLQKVLFTADEAHCASHPSKARAHTSKPIQNFFTRSVPFLCLLFTAAAAGIDCLIRFMTLFRPDTPHICAVGLASLRYQSGIGISVYAVLIHTCF